MSNIQDGRNLLIACQVFAFSWKVRSIFPNTALLNFRINFGKKGNNLGNVQKEGHMKDPDRIQDGSVKVPGK